MTSSASATRCTVAGIFPFPFQTNCLRCFRSTETAISIMNRYPRLLEFVAVLLVAILSSGCTVTRSVWKERLYHPHPETHLQLAASPERPLILIGYREQFEKSRHIRWRAFWLDLEDKYNPYSIPNFVDPANYPGLIPIPLLAPAQGTNAIPAQGYAALETFNRPGFELWKDGQPLGRFELPQYESDAPITVETVAKTPATVVADTMIVVGVVAGVIVLLYLSSLGDD